MTNGSNELTNAGQPALLPATGLAVPTFMSGRVLLENQTSARNAIRGFAR